jgi:hypothetical protein
MLIFLRDNEIAIAVSRCSFAWWIQITPR